MITALLGNFRRNFKRSLSLGVREINEGVEVTNRGGEEEYEAECGTSLLEVEEEEEEEWE